MFCDVALAAFADRGASVQVELAPLADPAIGALLTARGYRLVSFENVLGRRVAGGVEQVAPPGIEVRPSGDEELDAWLNLVVEGVAHPDARAALGHRGRHH